ncbi:enoyl-CoA hydratase [Curvivirga aplysinae]|uniref:enoyl-CoA hydratase n=1 Tax=Curvivirga aplysinae TaxID=2529852 RepID=UPI0012BCF0B0|nr:enoyl-CoA hydratase [Curvivirga aplysinae]MTI09006.1 enoyl-CoA hydratase [Curvivirga aplysinae]
MTKSEISKENLLLREDRNAVAYLTLNRPEAYNALSIDLMEAILFELDALDRNPEIAVVVIQGSGKGFCAGHDLKEMKATPTVEFRKKTFKTCSRMMQAIVNLRQPVIVKAHGIATAAGCQLVATADLAIAASDTRFATPGVNIGLFCSTPMVALSRAVSKKHAMEMLLTGDMVNAERAVEIGLINQHVMTDDLDPATIDLAEKIASKSPLVLKTGKEAFYKQDDMNLTDAYDYCAQVMVENMSFKDADEGIQAFIEKRPPIWTGQ